MPDERELRLEISDEFIIRRDHLAALLFGKRQVQAIVQPAFGLRGKGRGPAKEWLVRVQPWQIAEDVIEQGKRLPNWDELLPFTFGEGARGFGREDGRGNQLVDSLPIVVAETQRF